MYYEPLLSGQIRLLKILKDAAPLSITLHNFALDEAPEYDALSYTWGNETDGQDTIICNGSSILVRINLFQALHRLRNDASDNSWVWIDALCIDQSNVAEKSVQIPLMGRIYTQADQVLVWLGSADRDEETAVEHMAAIASALEDMREEIDD